MKNYIYSIGLSLVCAYAMAPLLFAILFIALPPGGFGVMWSEAVASPIEQKLWFFRVMTLVGVLTGLFVGAMKPFDQKPYSLDY